MRQIFKSLPRLKSYQTRINFKKFYEYHVFPNCLSLMELKTIGIHKKHISIQIQEKIYQFLMSHNCKFHSVNKCVIQISIPKIFRDVIYFVFVGITAVIFSPALFINSCVSFVIKMTSVITNPVTDIQQVW